jgi:hypothetical protein
MLLWSFEGDACGHGRDAGASTTWAVIAAGIHLFPFRTEKLSPPAPMVLGAQAPGRVGRRPDLAQTEIRELRISVVRTLEDARFHGRDRSHSPIASTWKGGRKDVFIVRRLRMFSLLPGELRD